jgi:hypothetical protein
MDRPIARRSVIAGSDGMRERLVQIGEIFLDPAGTVAKRSSHPYAYLWFSLFRRFRALSAILPRLSERRSRHCRGLAAARPISAMLRSASQPKQ